MRTRYLKGSGVGKKKTISLEGMEIPFDRETIQTLLREEVHGWATEFALRMAVGCLEDEVMQLCGPRYERPAERQASRYGHQAGTIILAGQKVPMRRPRVRYTDGRGEAALMRYTLMQRPEAMPQAVLRRLLRGVSCRDYEGVVETAREGFGVQRSSVSRHWVRATADQVEQMAKRRFDGVRFVALFIDGVVYAEETFVVALGLTAAGEKRLLGLRSGGTENAEVCASLLEELRERGVATDQATLLVLDGSKALTAAVKRVWGQQAMLQRCQEHKKRNVLAHVPKRHEAEARRRLNEAYRETAYARAVQLLRSTVRWLQTISPDAAASLREGLEETLTVVRLNVPEPLRRTLATTNPIESAFSVSATVTRRVKRWRDGAMRQRWCVAGLLRAESKFKRVRGYRQIPLLLKALESLGEGKDLDPSPEAA